MELILVKKPEDSFRDWHTNTFTEMMVLRLF